MSNSLISNLVKILSWVLMGVSTVIALLFFAGVVDENLFIIWAYVLLVIAAFFAVIFPVVFFVLYPKNAMKALVGLVGLGIAVLIGYLLSDTTTIITATNHPNFSNPKVLAFTDTGIIATYVLFGVAVLGLLFTGIRSIFHR
mgnify:CR=1 FL=1